MRKKKTIFKNCISVLLLLFMVISMIPTGITVAADSDIPFSEMEIGELYYAEFDYSVYPDLYLYGDGAGNTMYEYSEMKNIFPQELVVTRENASDIYVLATNDDWPTKYADYRYIDPAELIITGKCETEAPEDEDLIFGEVDLTDGINKLDELTVTAGEREYVYTNLGSQVGDKATYSWQILVDRKSNSWANIIDYCYPYAVVTEALILNSLDEDGKATMRCIVTEGENKFASNEIKISLERPVALLSDAVASNEITPNVAPTPKMVRGSQRAATDAFQITIEYVYLHANAVDPSLNGSTAANALTITLPPGTAFNNSITSPPIAGYKPYVEWKEGDSEEVPITYAGKQLIPADKVEFVDQSEGIHVIVYYVPQLVNYRVKYYKQNLRDDEYTEWKTEFMTGTADTAVSGDLAVAELGFSPLYYEKNTAITSDGNTVVEIYYDRNYYLLDYDIGDDAYGVAPSYVRYGTTLMLGSPTNPGYTFDGWKLTSVKDTRDGEELLTGDNIDSTYQNYNVTAANAQITIAHNLVYTAQWTATDVSFAIVYWKENANDNGYSCWGVQTVTGNRPGDVVTVDGTDIPQSIHNGEKNYFTYNSVLSDTQVTVKGDGSSVANVYYYRNIYTLTFNVAGLCNIPEGHTHTDACYDYICNGGNHVHDENCVLICTTEEHRHDPIACGCDVTEHTHTAACCTIPEHNHETSGCSCNKEEHTHTTGCWNNVGNKANNYYVMDAPTNAKDGQIYGVQFFGTTYYIYIKGSWYRYNSTATDGDVLSPDNCTDDEHTHGDGICNYACGMTAHDHTSGCNTDTCSNGGNEHTHGDGHCNYTCGKTAHTHNAACYDCGEDVHEHTDACKRLICAIPLNHSHTGNCNSTSQSSTVAMITGKYGSDIRDRFPLTGRDGADFAGYWWKVPNGATFLIANRSIVSLDQIPGENLTFDGDPKTGYTRAVIYYYIETLPGAPYVEGLPNAGDKHYELYKEVVTVKSGYLTTEEEFHTIAGFTRGNYYPSNIFDSSVADENYLYYTRNSYALQFHSNNVHLTDLDKTVLYGASMSSYAAILPTYPTAFEQNAYKFAGWYTTPGCYDGTEFNFESETMPDHNVLLYAKWVPTSWSVEVYLDDDKTIPLYSDTLPFGSKIPEPDYKDAQMSHPAYKDLIWAGWYYKNAAGEEVRFDFNTMALKTNYNGTVDPVTGEQYPSAIYAKWTSEVPVAYTVYYVTKDTNGDYIDVADPTTGVALAGINKSFIAKSGEDINADYKTYLPVKRSITHEMSLIADENVIYFEYVTTHDIVYTIKHVFTDSDFVSIKGSDTFELSWSYTITTSDDDFSGKIMISFDSHLEDHVLADDDGAALWKIIKNLSPDAYKQELILTASETNEVVFNWEDHGEVFLYQVIHYFQKLDYSSLPADEQYTAEYYQEFVGAYGDESSITIKATPVERQGFEISEAEDKKSKLEMTLKKSDVGIKERVLEVYYDRVTITYEVQHIYGGTVKTEKKPALYEQVVTETAKTDILGYVIADPDQAEQSVSITYDGQMIKFYYVAQQVIFNYQVIDNVGGYLSTPQETVSIGSPAAGVTPIEAPGYIFIGWYTDEDATTKVDDTWVDASGKLTPVAFVADANKMVTYYAKFAPNSLTIQNGISGVSEAIDPELDIMEQGFIYTIQGKAGTATDGVYLRVAVVAGESKTILALPVGEYTVTVEDEWSWRYTSVDEVQTTMADGTNSQNTSVSDMTWTLVFTGSGDMVVVYGMPGMDIVGDTQDSSHYYVTDNTHN